jgi:excisionase family DNA binding protein
VSADRLMTLAEVADRLQVSIATVQRRVRAGEIAVLNVGSRLRPRLRVTEADYQRYLASRRITRWRVG